MDIYGYLQKDHANIAPLIDQLKIESSLQKRIEIITKIRKEFTRHVISDYKDFYLSWDNFNISANDSTNGDHPFSDMSNTLDTVSTRSQ